MEQTIKLEMTKDEAAKMSAAIEQCLKTFDESNEHSRQTQAEIDRLQVETSAMLDQLRTMFNAETGELQRTQNDLKNIKEFEGYERELFWLEVENQLLKVGHYLPPTSDVDDEENER